MSRFRLHPIAARWLRAESGSSSEAEPPDWDTWLLRRMSHGDVIHVGGVLVDRAVLHQRFACVSDRCAPGSDRGQYRSCCADAFVPLTRAEDRRLARHGPGLFDWLKAREPRLARCHGPSFHRATDELGLARPEGRCVFSQLDRRGRIRCHLHAYAQRARVDRGELQPVGCRLFPLIVVDRGAGRALLTVVARHTRRLVGAHPAHRYPCLDDTSLPFLYESMQGDLDWLFGAGFAEALANLR
jgi:hypothetical protein